jgi:hypothetical protein
MCVRSEGYACVWEAGPAPVLTGPLRDLGGRRLVGRRGNHAQELQEWRVGRVCSRQGLQVLCRGVRGGVCGREDRRETLAVLCSRVACSREEMRAEPRLGVSKPKD